MKFIVFARVVFISLVLFASLVFWKSPHFARATYNEFFTRWHFKMPPPGTTFIVQNICPRAIERVIRRAFPEYKVVFTQTPTEKPHLVLKNYYTPTHGHEKEHVPYMAFSGEYASLRWKRFFPSGYPFLEITANETEGENFIFMPYIAYGKTNLRKNLHEALEKRAHNMSRPNQVVYISSHCVRERDQMFTLLRKRFQDQAHSLGKCMLTASQPAEGGYHDLTSIYEQYNFGLAMENHDRKGYVTEKIMNAFEGGAIPIYWGDDVLAKKWFNPDAFISIKDFPSFKAAADAIYILSQNPERLTKMLQAPLFKDGKIPSLLLINDDVLTHEEEVILHKMATKVREAYESYIAHRNAQNPYFKALAFKENIKSKLEHTALWRFIKPKVDALASMLFQ